MIPRTSSTPLALLLLALVGLTALALLTPAGRRVCRALLGPPGPASAQTRTPAPATVILTRLREESRLVTLTVECGPWEERLEQHTSLRFWPDADETMTALACGQVFYGVDFSELRPEDVSVSGNGRRASVVLPPVRKLGDRLDLGRTRIVAHSVSWYWRRDPTLRDAVLKQAAARLSTLESTSGLDRARSSALEQVTRLLRELGIIHVAVTFRDGASSASPGPDDASIGGPDADTEVARPGPVPAGPRATPGLQPGHPP